MGFFGRKREWDEEEIKDIDDNVEDIETEILQSLNMKVNKDNLNIITLSFENEMANMLREVAMNFFLDNGNYVCVQNEAYPTVDESILCVLTFVKKEHKEFFK